MYGSALAFVRFGGFRFERPGALTSLLLGEFLLQMLELRGGLARCSMLFSWHLGWPVFRFRFVISDA